MGAAVTVTAGRNIVELVRRLLAPVRRSLWWWRWVTNFERTVRYRRTAHHRGSAPWRVDVEALRRDGIVILRADEVFDAAGLELVDQISALFQKKLSEPSVQEVLRAGDSRVATKEYRLHLLPKAFEIAHPCVQLAIRPGLLDRVNEYLGLQSYLRAIVGWLDFPSPGPAKETQLWHRDPDDFMVVKVFIYLEDVTRRNGPFCFVPGTHAAGRLRWLRAGRGGRVSDAEMASVVPPEHRVECTGLARTVIMADTTGYHRGLKPEDGYRVLLQFTYTSAVERYPRDFVLLGASGTGLSAAQRSALVS